MNIATSYHGNGDAYIRDSQLDISIFKSIIIHDKAISSRRKIFQFKIYKEKKSLFLNSDLDG
jgi:hypothetical protein